jgi:hypothetical protein
MLVVAYFDGGFRTWVSKLDDVGDRGLMTGSSNSAASFSSRSTPGRRRLAVSCFSLSRVAYTHLAREHLRALVHEAPVAGAEAARASDTN